MKEAEDIAFLSLGYLFKNNLTSVSNSSTKGQNKQPWKLWMIVNEFAFFRDLKQHIRNLLGIHFIKCYTLERQETWRKKSRGMNFKKTPPDWENTHQSHATHPPISWFTTCEQPSNEIRAHEKKQTKIMPNWWWMQHKVSLNSKCMLYAQRQICMHH